MNYKEVRLQFTGGTNRNAVRILMRFFEKYVYPAGAPATKTYNTPQVRASPFALCTSAIDSSGYLTWKGGRLCAAAEGRLPVIDNRTVLCAVGRQWAAIGE